MKPVTNPLVIEASPMERAIHALEMRRSGFSYEEIAQGCGYGNVKAAYNAVSSVLAQMAEEPAAEVRRLELMRLDSLLRALWPSAMAGDIDSVGMALRIEQTRCKILGLFEPVKVDIEFRIRAMAESYGLSGDEAVMAAQEYLKKLRISG